MQEHRQKALFISAIVILAVIALVEGIFLLGNSFALMLRNEPRWRDWAASVSKTFRMAPPPVCPPQAGGAAVTKEDVILQETADDIERMQDQINRLFYEMTKDAAFAPPHIRPMAPGHDVRFPFENTSLGSSRGEAGEAWVKHLQSEIERIFQRAHEGRHGGVLHLIEQDWRDVGEISSVNVEENGTNYAVTVSVPGFEKEDIIVSLNGRLLSVEAGVEHQQATRGSQEASSGRFKTQIRLPIDVDGESAQAFYENNILKITIPKKPEGNSLARKIKIM